MPPRMLVVVAALRLAASVYAASADPVSPPASSDDWSGLERTPTRKTGNRGELVRELPAVDLPAGPVVDQAAWVGESPVNGSIYALPAELVDETGRHLPAGLLHHMNVMDPSERELFLPISRRILASGMETGEIRFPWLLFGSPIRAGQRILANAMVHNPTTVDYHGVRVPPVLSYVPDHRPWPFFSVIPWQLDVAFPLGDQWFDLPPGRSERAYEGSPAVDGKIIIIGGHMHEDGKTIEFWDVTKGEMLWDGETVSAAPGQPNARPT